MKKNIFQHVLLLTLMAAMTLNSYAQVRRTNIGARPRGAAPSRPAQQKQVEKRWCCYEYGIRHMALADSVIYILESDESNAVLAIDNQTGRVSTVIPGIKGIYEGARPRIHNIWYADGKLILLTRKRGNEVGTFTYSMRIWDGQSVTTSKSFAAAMDIVAHNGKYVLYYIEVPDKDDASWTTNYYVLYDLEAMKGIIRFPVEKGFGMMEHCQMDANGTCWGVNNGSVWQVTKEGKSKYFKLFNQPYFVALKENEGYTPNSLEEHQMTLQGDYIYVAVKRRIFRMNVTEPGTWEEYLKVPPTQAEDFYKVGALPDGSLVTFSEVSKDYAMQFFEVRAFDSPVALGEHPSLPDGMLKSELYVQWCRMHTDALGNIIVLEDWAEGKGGVHENCDLWILNPKGVQGFSNAVGKIMKPAK